MSLTNTEWKRIRGFSRGGYLITPNGKIFYPLKGRFLTQTKRGGYLAVMLVKRKRCYKNCSVHRLVAEVFIPNPEKKPCVHHKDGDVFNNCVENLEWVTYKEHLAGYRNTSGEKNGRVKLTVSQVIEIRRDHEISMEKYKRSGRRVRPPWKRYGISKTHYYRILARKSWKGVDDNDK